MHLWQFLNGVSLPFYWNLFFFPLCGLVLMLPVSSSSFAPISSEWNLHYLSQYLFKRWTPRPLICVWPSQTHLAVFFCSVVWITVLWKIQCGPSCRDLADFLRFPCNIFKYCSFFIFHWSFGVHRLLTLQSNPTTWSFLHHWTVGMVLLGLKASPVRCVTSCWSLCPNSSIFVLSDNMTLFQKALSFCSWVFLCLSLSNGFSLARYPLRPFGWRTLLTVDTESSVPQAANLLQMIFLVMLGLFLTFLTKSFSCLDVD